MLILSRFFLFRYFHGYKKPYKDTFFCILQQKNSGYIWWKRIFIVPLQPQIRNSTKVLVCQFSWLEYMPVTHGVTSSSLVHTATVSYFIWCVSSVGQNTCLSRMGSRVRASYTPQKSLKIFLRLFFVTKDSKKSDNAKLLIYNVIATRKQVCSGQ